MPADLPLQGCRVVVTRAREQSAELVERLRHLGAETVECPAIRIEEPENFAEVDDTLLHLNHYNWIIFSSTNAVGRFKKRLAKLVLQGYYPSYEEALAGIRIAAVGPKTAAEVSWHPVDFIPDTYTAEALVEQIGDVAGQRILLVQGNIARDTIEVGLRAKGAEVDAVIAYRTMPGTDLSNVAEQLLNGRIDAITFTSPSTIKNFLDGLVNAGLTLEQAQAYMNKTGIVCIGPVTGEAAQKHGLHVSAVAEEHTIPGLVDALVNLWKAHSSFPQVEKEHST